jgi:molybdenum cofactor cytidylyltransferase
MTFAVVVLAAGGSTRMGGRFKLLEDLGGRPLVLWSVEAAMGSRCRPVVVVLGNRAEEVRRALPAGVEVVVCDGWREGMSSSIREGVRALPRESEGVVICLGDMPFVTTRTIDRLASAARERGIAYCRVGGEIRSPSAFRSEFYADLMALRGDAGAKEVIRRNMDRAVGLEVDPVELLDVDTEEDLELARMIASEKAVNRRK